jgi:hypothetical protein
MLDMPTTTRPGVFLRRLQIGRFNQEGYRTYVRNIHPNLADRTTEMLGHPHFTCAETRGGIDMWTVAPEDFGYTSRILLTDLYAPAAALGFSLCLSEAGPALWLDYTTQPKGESIVIAMEPLVGSDDNRRVFAVQHTPGGQRRLYWELIQHVAPHTRVAFVR